MRTRSSRTSSVAGDGARDCDRGGRLRAARKRPWQWLRSRRLSAPARACRNRRSARLKCPLSASIFAAAGAGCIAGFLLLDRRLAGDPGRSSRPRPSLWPEPALPAACATASGFAAGLSPAPSPIVPRSAPRPTVSPSFADISESVPAAGAGTSTVTLSVSSSTSGSSAAMASPTFLNHLPMVASVTDSPRVGTRISVAMVFIRCFSIRFDHSPSASSRSDSSCARCFDIRPVAGEAAAGRPV